MAVPEDKKTILCPKCFATVETGAPFCPECGVSMASSDGSDAEIYPMLARANLLRMRGEYEQAQGVCLKILKRFPNNATANTLLGDICAERGDLEQSAQWYEMALEVVPDSKVDKQKLAAVRQRIHERDTAATADQIGIPSKRRNALTPILLTIGLMAAIAFAAYFFGVNKGSEPGSGQVVDVAGGGSGRIDTGRPGYSEESQPQTSAQSPRYDAAFTARIAQALGDDGRLALDAWEHPSTHDILVVLNGDGKDDHRRFAASMAGKIIEQLRAPTVTVRVISGGKEVFVGKVGRKEVDDLLAAASSDSDPYAASDAADRLLVEEWPARTGKLGEGSTAVTGGAPPSGEGTTGAAGPGGSTTAGTTGTTGG